MNTQVAMPEFLSRDDIDPRSWSVQQGAPLRGDAWTEMRTATMRVPFGDDEMSRVIRAHELTHAKISPIDKATMESYIEEHRLTRDSVISAEEFRVNMTIKHLGFDIDALRDGSEFKAGQICGHNNNWNGMVRFVASTAGSKACNDFVRGISKTNPALGARAKEVQKELLKYHKKLLKYHGINAKESFRYISDTTPVGRHQVPAGFDTYTRAIAEMLDTLLIPEGGGGPNGEPDSSPEEGNTPSPADVFGGRAGKFADLIEDVRPKPRHVDGKLGRKRVAVNVGKNPRRINRMLVDPERRIFDRRAKGRGGVVLIDQSGSMSLSDSDIWNIISHAPGCLIIGYSHRADSTTIPNVWVIADRGKVVEQVPEGNGGNGVDGPAIRFAQARRRYNEPFIWVCDGIVTDGKGDNEYPNLTDECAKLVAKHNIHMVDDVNEAIEAFKSIALGRRLETTFTGPIRSAAKRLGFV